jgi:hypothetical protein
MHAKRSSPATIKPKLPVYNLLSQALNATGGFQTSYLALASVFEALWAGSEVVAADAARFAFRFVW